MDDTQFADTIARYEELEPKIRAVRQYNTKTDLLRIARSCINLREEISKELVQCRRLKQPTVKYHGLMERYSQHVNTLEEYTTFALLLDH